MPIFTYSTLSDVVCSNTKFSNLYMNELTYSIQLLHDNSPFLLIIDIKNTFIRHKANLSGVILNEPIIHHPSVLGRKFYSSR